MTHTETFGNAEVVFCYALALLIFAVLMWAMRPPKG